MRLFLLAAMTILPGSWFTFGIPLDEVNWRTRLALGAALSPIVLAIQLYISVTNPAYRDTALLDLVDAK